MDGSQSLKDETRNIDDGEFPKHDWSHTPHSSKKESIPGNHPESRGHGFNIIANVDSDHAGDRKFGDTKSRTGILMLCNGMHT